jgi:hypothetical protein
MPQDTAKAGGFEIEVTGPYPAWCDIKYGDQRISTIHHKELSDLRYAVEKAMQIARLKLGKDAAEV